MAARRSAGILVYRRRPSGPEVLLGHMGGPFWSNRDTGAWSLPKGEYDADEEPVAAARREFVEELGVAVPSGTFVDLGATTQSSGKVVTIWAVEGELDVDGITPDSSGMGTFSMEWPRGSGRFREFPEIDRARWFGLDAARDKIVRGQRTFLDRLERILDR